MSRATVASIVVTLLACAQWAWAAGAKAGEHDALIAQHAAANGVPEQLVRRIIRIESRGNPRAVSKGNYGLMQIRLGTARAMGYSGTAAGLLEPETNLKYAVKYLAGAYRAAKCNAERAIAFYQRGYYGAAQIKCGVSQAVSAQTEPPKAVEAVQRSPDVVRPRIVRVQTIIHSKIRRPITTPAKFAPY